MNDDLGLVVSTSTFFVDAGGIHTCGGFIHSTSGVAVTTAIGRGTSRSRFCRVIILDCSRPSETGPKVMFLSMKCNGSPPVPCRSITYCSVPMPKTVSLDLCSLCFFGWKVALRVLEEFGGIVHWDGSTVKNSLFGPKSICTAHLLGTSEMFSTWISCLCTLSVENQKASF